MDEPVYRIDAASERRHLTVFALLAVLALGQAALTKQHDHPTHESQQLRAAATRG